MHRKGCNTGRGGGAGRGGGSWRYVLNTCRPGAGGGRLSFISLTPGGSSFRYQGCRWMSSTVKRLAGSGTSICLSRSRHSRLTRTCGGNSYSTRKMRCKAISSTSVGVELCEGILLQSILLTSCLTVQVEATQSRCVNAQCSA